MLRLIIALLILCGPAITLAANAEPTNNANIASYSIGYDFGRSLRSHKVSDLNDEYLIQGVKDALSGNDPKFNEEQLSKALQELFQKEKLKMAALKKENKAKNQEFLTQNSKKDGVQVTESGLQYKIIKQGDGPKPKLEDTVVAHYRGTLINGTEFDSSYARNKPATFRVKGVIEGWQQALQMMSTGSEWELYIPPELAYGDRSPSAAIPPNSLLIFNVKLLEIKEGVNK